MTDLIEADIIHTRLVLGAKGQAAPELGSAQPQLVSYISYLSEELPTRACNKTRKQAGAELCQAQEKLGLVSLHLPIMKLYCTSIYLPIEIIIHFAPKDEVVFHFGKKLRSSSILAKN